MVPSGSVFRSQILPALVVGALVSAACSDRGSGGAHALLSQDSAGVQIVESSSPGLATQAWHLSELPSLEIGADPAEPPYQLYRVVDAVRLSDGRIVVANQGSYELRYYDSDGIHLQSVGRRGEGPGEFGGLASLIRGGGDTLIAADGELQRLSYFSPDGEFIRSYAVREPEGRFADGSYVYTVWGDRAPPSKTGHVREPRRYVRYWPEQGEADTLLTVAGNDSYRERITVGDETRLAYVRPLFARQLQTAVSGDRIYSGTANGFQYSVFGLEGQLRRVVRWPGELEPVTEEDRAAFLNSWLETASSDEERRRIRRQAAEQPARDTMPAYSDLQLDRSQHVWVERFQPSWDRGPAEWWVFDTSGRWLTTVEIPGRFDVTEIGSDYVLGVWTNEMDVESVRLYRLRSASGEQSASAIK